MKLMQHARILVASLVLLVPAVSPAQYAGSGQTGNPGQYGTQGPYGNGQIGGSTQGRGQRGRRGTVNPTNLPAPAVSFHGTLKALTSKEIVIQLVDEEDQTLEMRRNKKTKFLKGDKTINPIEIPEDAKLTVDVVKDPDMKLRAVAVMVEVPKPEAKAK